MVSGPLYVSCPGMMNFPQLREMLFPGGCQNILMHSFMPMVLPQSQKKDRSGELQA